MLFQKRKINNNRLVPIENEPIVDGVKGFLFLSRINKPFVGYQWASKFKYAVDKYNSIYKRELPPITPHVCRYTYCTRQWQKGYDVKTITALKGHSSIEITLDTYIHCAFDDLERAVNNV